MQKCSGPGPKGPYTKRLSEDRNEGIERLEALRDNPSTSDESRAVLNRIINRTKENPLLVDLTADERNWLQHTSGKKLKELKKMENHQPKRSLLEAFKPGMKVMVCEEARVVGPNGAVVFSAGTVLTESFGHPYVPGSEINPDKYIVVIADNGSETTLPHIEAQKIMVEPLKPLDAITHVGQLDNDQVVEIAKIIESTPELSIIVIVAMVTDKTIAVQDEEAFDREFANRLGKIKS